MAFRRDAVFPAALPAIFGKAARLFNPCPNQAETLAACIDQTKGFPTCTGIKGEGLISDNGPTDDQTAQQGQAAG